MTVAASGFRFGNRGLPNFVRRMFMHFCPGLGWYERGTNDSDLMTIVDRFGHHAILAD
jgi:hypothetical protein